MKVVNGSSTYEVGKLVAETTAHRVYVTTEEGVNGQALLQVATQLQHNGGLERAAYLLKELKRRAEEVEAEYAKLKDNPGHLLHYEMLFPDLIDSFVSQEHGARRINVLAFRDIDKVSRMVPLSNLAKDRLRVDLRTSAWIMGRLLKLLTFVHGEGISVKMMGASNVLIEPKSHYVVIFDWSSARLYPKTIPADDRRKDVAQAAQTVIGILGGDPLAGSIPDATDEESGYTDYLVRLARGRESNAQEAHAAFYRIVDALWKREYYRFTTKPLAG